jgi:TM2 domain-containing membrane protein YozV
MECPICGKVNDSTARYCRSCGSTLDRPKSSPEPVPGLPPNAPAPTVRFAQGRKTVVAVLFSCMFPGLGQFYNGDFKKGFLLFVLGAIAFFLLLETACVAFLPLSAVWLWGVVNAYYVAARKTPLWS